MPGGTTLANAYVQILPTTKGIKGNLEKEMGDAGESAGRKSGGKFSGAFGKVAVAGAAAAGVALGKSLMEGASLEQSKGGVETLFGKNAKQVIADADAAWKTAGLSANDYMEQATSSAAALLKSLGGDTKAASKYTNMAITDMADNANKFGTNIEDIQNAYKGFAKQNYTMLDNLSLGYAGTKTGMEELLADAEKLPAAMGKKFDINNLNDVYDAIHLIQEDLGVAGTTADEAEKTLSGSFAAMKASADNFMGNLVARPEMVNQSMQDLVTSTNTFLTGNLIPAIGNVIQALPGAISTFMSQGAPQLLGTAKSLITGIVNALPGMISTLLNKGVPQLIQSGKALLEGLTQGIGNTDLASKILPILTKFSAKLPAMAGGLIDAGMGLLQKLVQGFVKALPVMIAYIPKIITNLANVINNNAPKLLSGGAHLIMMLIKGIISAVPTLLRNIPQIFKAFLAVWQAVNWLNLGKLAFNGVKKGMQAAIKTLGPMVKKGFSAVKNAMLAPSKAMAALVKAAMTKVKNAFNLSSIVGKVKATFAKAKDAIVRPIQSAKDKLSGIIKKIKGLFPLSVGKIMSNLRVPKISVEGGKPPFGIGGKGSLPKIGVHWNKLGGIVDEPTILQGAGEAGPEGIIPLTLFWKKMDAIARSIETSNGSGGTLQLVINLDSRTIGQATVDYLNGQTLMFGTNPVLV